MKRSEKGGRHRGCFGFFNTKLHIMSGQQQSDGFGGSKNKQRFDGSGSGRSNFGGQDFKRGGNRDNGRTQMFSATCSHCGRPCTVPFRPSGDKPVYCKECFMSRRESSSRNQGRREAPSRDFQKRGVAPVFLSKPPGADTRLDDLKRELHAMNAKLDLVIQKLNGGGLQTPKLAGKKVSVTAKTAASKKPRKAAKSPKK